MRSRRFSRAWRPFGRPPSLYYGFSILPENHPSLRIPVWGWIPASVKMLPPLLATTYNYWLRNQTVVACLCFGPVFQFLGLIKTRAFRALLARLGRALFAPLVWRALFPSKACRFGICAFCARNVFGTFRACACSRLVHGQNRSAICRRPRVCFSPAP